MNIPEHVHCHTSATGGDRECRDCFQHISSLLRDSGVTGALDSALRPGLLLVDRDAGEAGRLADLLRPLGMEVHIAGTAREALASFARLHQPISLIDVELSDLRAADLVRRLTSEDPDHLAVVRASRENLDPAVEAVTAGAFAFLLKESSDRELRTALSRATDRLSLQVGQRRLQRQLVAERNRIRTTLRYLQSGILSLDAEFGIVSSNPAVEAITGMTPDQVHTFGDLIRAVTMGGSTAQHVHETLERCLVTGSTAHLPELRIQRQPDGRTRTVHMVASPVLDEGTTGISLVIALNDVTESWELARRASRTERLAAIGEMAASVAHEIKNPLAGIGAALDVLLAEDSDPEFQVLKREIRNQLRRLNELVTDLMNFAKPISIHPEEIVFEDLVRATMQALRHHPALARVEIVVEGGATRLKVDPLQFPHVLQNLVLNSAQATGRSGRVTLRAIPVHGGTEVTVEDQGQGLSEALLGRIFKPFFTTKAQGTGLGLSLCRKIVEAHGGTIEAHNAPEGGAVFVTRLPLPTDVSARKLELA